MGITPTGNSRIDEATAELALELRMAHPSMREQSLYNEAMRIRDEIMAGTRELPEPLPAWRPAVNGTGRAPWFLYRGWGEEAERVPLDERYYLKGNGQLCRFTTRENAQKVADRLNGKPAGLLPASASPTMITDDIALNMAAIVLDAMGRDGLAGTLRKLLPAAEGKVHGVAYQEPAGKWGQS